MKPFFLAVWTHEPHDPIASEERHEKLHAGIAGREERTYRANVTLRLASATVMLHSRPVGVRGNHQPESGMPAHESRSESRQPAPAGTASSRIGLALFWIYVLLYGGFIGIVLFRPDLLSRRPFGGVNLAIAYGMGLIAGAFLLAIIYMAACRAVEHPRPPRG
jgi:hypothetical protein